MIYSYVYYTMMAIGYNIEMLAREGGSCLVELPYVVKVVYVNTYRIYLYCIHISGLVSVLLGCFYMIGCLVYTVYTLSVYTLSIYTLSIYILPLYLSIYTLSIYMLSIYIT